VSAHECETGTEKSPTLYQKSPKFSEKSLWHLARICYKSTSLYQKSPVICPHASDWLSIGDSVATGRTCNDCRSCTSGDENIVRACVSSCCNSACNSATVSATVRTWSARFHLLLQHSPARIGDSGNTYVCTRILRICTCYGYVLFLSWKRTERARARVSVRDRQRGTGRDSEK